MNEFSLPLSHLCDSSRVPCGSTTENRGLNRISKNGVWVTKCVATEHQEKRSGEVRCEIRYKSRSGKEDEGDSANRVGRSKFASEWGSHQHIVGHLGDDFYRLYIQYIVQTTMSKRWRWKWSVEMKDQSIENWLRKGKGEKVNVQVQGGPNDQIIVLNRIKACQRDEIYSSN